MLDTLPSALYCGILRRISFPLFTEQEEEAWPVRGHTAGLSRQCTESVSRDCASPGLQESPS